MRLVSLEYAEHTDNAQKWELHDLVLGSKNLLVGKNSTGKTRTLNIINGVSRSLADIDGIPKNIDVSFIFSFQDGTYEYSIQAKDGLILNEYVKINGDELLKRGDDGFGEIFTSDAKKLLRFQSPPNKLAAVLRRDTIQHAFLEPLYEWAASVRHYSFGSSLGKDHINIQSPITTPLDERDPNSVGQVFKHALAEFSDQFLNALVSDLQLIDYHIDNVEIAEPISINILNFPGTPTALRVKEKGFPGIIDQFSMSQGMFRVLSLLIHLNYAQLTQKASCLIIDDIGEGLDYERSCALIDLLRKKADTCNAQLIMSTNDRFVMNSVPLEEWSVLQRKGNVVHVKNIHNSRAIFENFKYTGLSNFSFFELDYINTNDTDE